MSDASIFYYFHIPTMNEMGIDQLTSEYVPATNTALYVILVLLALRFLNCLSYAEVPQVVLNESERPMRRKGEIVLKDVLAECPILKEKYAYVRIFFCL